jgi:hypothetical protein
MLVSFVRTTSADVCVCDELEARVVLPHKRAWLRKGQH